VTLILISYLCIQLGPIQSCEISDHQSGFSEDSSLLRCYAVKSDKWLPKFCSTGMPLVSSRPRRFLLTQNPVLNFNNLPKYWLQTCSLSRLCSFISRPPKKKLQPTCLWNISSETLSFYRKCIHTIKHYN